jgi:hypothetical protein
MPGVDNQYDLQILSEQRDYPAANLDPTSTSAVANISLVDV